VDLVISEQASALTDAVTERSETGKLNNLCSFWICSEVQCQGSMMLKCNKYVCIL
jgi:hypothetical protein